MDVLEAHRRATDGFDEVVRGVRADRLDGPTPCSAWTVRDLLRHVVEEQLWVPVLLDGARPADVGEPAGVDDVRRDAVAAWEPRAAAARTAWTRPGVLERTVHLSFADVPAVE